MRTTSSLLAGEASASPALLGLAGLPLPDAAPPPGPDEQDSDDLSPGVDEDALEADEVDFDRITSPD